MRNRNRRLSDAAFEPLSQRDPKMMERWKHRRRRRVCERKLPRGYTTPAHLFATSFGKLGSEGILAALGEHGVGCEWFADKFKALWEDKATSKHAKLRMMNLLAGLVRQQEGQMVTVQGLADREQAEIEAQHKLVKAEILEIVGGEAGCENEGTGDSSGGTEAS